MLPGRNLCKSPERFFLRNPTHIYGDDPPPLAPCEKGDFLPRLSPSFFGRSLSPSLLILSMGYPGRFPFPVYPTEQSLSSSKGVFSCFRRSFQHSFAILFYLFFPIEHWQTLVLLLPESFFVKFSFRG